MTHDYGTAPEAEDVVVAWLTPLGATSVERPAGDSLPFRMVTRVAGADDKVTDAAVVDVDTFASTRGGALTAAKAVHRRMISLMPDDEITLPSGEVATVDRVRTDHGPIYVPWSADQSIKRYVARYIIDLRMVLTDYS